MIAKIQSIDPERLGKEEDSMDLMDLTGKGIRLYFLCVLGLMRTEAGLIRLWG